jgi:hypothetical protein
MIARRIRLAPPRRIPEPLTARIESPDVIQRDDGWFELLPCGSGPFPSRAFANAVWLTRHPMGVRQ